MDENAISRLMFVCGKARRFPTVIVTADKMAMVNDQSRAIGTVASGKIAKNKRISTAKPAAFDAVDKNPATGVGEPSYTSGAQKWNGTNETLKPIPTRIKARTPSAPNKEKPPDLIMTSRLPASL